MKIINNKFQWCLKVEVWIFKVAALCFLVKKDAMNKKMLGKLPGLVVNVKDSQSEPWFSDMGSIPGFT
jgi:hypothetical protein